MTGHDDIKARLLDAALPHVAFDGWSERCLTAAIGETGIDPVVARAACPRGAVDLALALHARGDAAMLERLSNEDLSALRFRDRVATAVRYRLEALGDKEVVRRATALFALPPYAADGATAIWGTADKVWTALGDNSEDYNWYSKRATLSGVYAATVLYWLGDQSPDHQATWAFLDRRIDDVMQIERVKSRVRANPLLSQLLKGPSWLLSGLRPPSGVARADLPGHRNRPGGGPRSP